MEELKMRLWPLIEAFYAEGWVLVDIVPHDDDQGDLLLEKGGEVYYSEYAVGLLVQFGDYFIRNSVDGLNHLAREMPASADNGADDII